MPVGASDHDRVANAWTTPPGPSYSRRLLDEFEWRYGVVSEHLAEAFTTASGQLVATGAYLRWEATLERWRQLTRGRVDT